METVNGITEEERKAWLEKRRLGNGGSDAAATLGLSPWKSALQVWAEKTGKIQGDTLEDLEYIEWGSILEDPIARKFSRVTGRTLMDHGRHAIRFSEAYPYMHCTIDREILQIDDRGPGDLSIKNANEFSLRDWEEDVPLHYQIQLQHELAVLGWAWGSFGVLIGGNKFRWKDSARNDQFIAYLIEREGQFWDLVQRDIPPEPDASESAKETISRLYPKDTGRTVRLPPEAVVWAQDLEQAKESRKILDGEITLAENRLKAAIGDATFGVAPDGTRFSWKWQKRSSFSVNETEFRVLRRTK